MREYDLHLYLRIMRVCSVPVGGQTTPRPETMRARADVELLTQLSGPVERRVGLAVAVLPDP
jgi:hypothetical protein